MHSRPTFLYEIYISSAELQMPLTNIPSAEFDTLETQKQPNALNAKKKKTFKTII